MKASFDINAKTKFTSSHRKENNYTKSYKGLVWDGEKIREVVDVRFYDTAARTYCCVWVHATPVFTSGSAVVGGYGYHFASAAFSSALANAGFKLSQSISGFGDSAIESAIQAICEFLFVGCPVKVIVCYG